MPDAPDWYKYRKESTREVLGDLAEHAVRLGSSVTYDRGGSVVWVDDISYGIGPYMLVASGAGASYKVACSKGLHGGYNLELVAGSDGDRKAYFYKYFSPQYLNKWGIELGVNFASRYDQFRFSLNYIDDDNFYGAYIKLDDVNDLIKYRDSDGDYQTIGDLPDFVHIYGQVQNIKLVADFENYMYSYLLLNQTKYDLSTYAMYHSTPSEVRQSRCNVSFTGRAGENDSCLMDHIIITTGEP